MHLLLRKVHWWSYFRSTRGEAVSSFPLGVWTKAAERKKPKTQLARSMTSIWKTDLGITVWSSVSNIFFLNQLSHFFSMMNSSFQRCPPTPPSISTQQRYSMCLLYSAFSCSIFLPYPFCTPSHFPCLFKCAMILTLLSPAAEKKERTCHDLLQEFLQNRDWDLGLGPERTGNA